MNPTTLHAGHERTPATTHEPHALHGGHGPYARLAAMVGLSFLAMFVLMYAMVDRVDNALPNVNQVWMAGLMAAPMLVLELVLMRAMYPNRTANVALVALGVVLTLGFFVAIRQQTAVGDRQFLKSMIPHHAGAVLMCREASLADPDVVRLCASIVVSQQKEIEEMQALLAREDALANAEPKR